MMNRTDPLHKLQTPSKRTMSSVRRAPGDAERFSEKVSSTKDHSKGFEAESVKPSCSLCLQNMYFNASWIVRLPPLLVTMPNEPLVGLEVAPPQFG